MTSMLLIYSTTDGHTRKISQTIQSVIQQDGHNVTLLSIDELSQTNLNTFDKIILGASIRYGKHQKMVYDFISENQSLLKDKPSAFFSVNVVARKADKNTPDTNPYVKKFLSQIPWTPDLCAVFAGKINYPEYRFFDRMMIRLIMAMTHGPTDPTTVIEFTDWEQVERFAQSVVEL